MVYADTGVSGVSVDSVLDGAFTILLAKAQRKLLDTPPVTMKPASVNFEWTGGGAPIAVAIDPITFVSAPTAADPVLIEIPFPCSIGWAHLFAGDAAGRPMVASATVDVQLTQITNLGSSIALYGTGAIPQLSNASAAIIDLTNWQPNLLTSDILIARLTAFTGLATWVALTLQLVPTDVGLGLIPVVDGAANLLTDGSGNTLVLRN